MLVPLLAILNLLDSCYLCYLTYILTLLSTGNEWTNLSRVFLCNINIELCKQIFLVLLVVCLYCQFIHPKKVTKSIIQIQLYPDNKFHCIHCSHQHHFHFSVYAPPIGIGLQLSKMCFHFIHGLSLFYDMKKVKNTVSNVN